MSDKKIIAVIGATGAQGGSVINAILNDSSKNFAVRAITRDSTKPNAQKLKERGCEVVEADLSNKDSLQKAFEGAYGVFGVTDFWATMNADIEISQGKNIADAAKVRLPSNPLLSIASLASSNNATQIHNRANTSPLGRRREAPRVFVSHQRLKSLRRKTHKSDAF